MGILQEYACIHIFIVTYRYILYIQTDRNTVRVNITYICTYIHTYIQTNSHTHTHI